MAQSWHSPIMQEGCKAMPEPLCTLQTQDCSKPPFQSFGSQHSPWNISSSIPFTVIPPEQGCNLLLSCYRDACYFHVQAAIYVTDTVCSAGRSLRQGHLVCWDCSIHTSCESHHGKVPFSKMLAGSPANLGYTGRFSHSCCCCTCISIFITLISFSSLGTPTWNWSGLKQRQ